MNRNNDADAAMAARINAESWRVLDEFRFRPDSASDRLARAGLPLAILLLWLVVCGGITALAARKVRI